MELNKTNTLRQVDEVAHGKHIVFVRVGTSPTGKTNIYWVANKETNHMIGQINWYSAWYQYSFFPSQGTVFEKQCLRDIANFCEEETKKHRSIGSRKS